MIPLKVRSARQRIPGRISVVLPSRKRPDMLRRSLKSLYDNLSSVDSNVEILVAYDPDDTETYNTARNSDFSRVQGWQSPGRYGYGGIANYYVPLLELARGDWVVMWGDDAFMMTKNWDKLVRKSPPSVLYTNGGYKEMNCFPIVHIDIFEAVGRFTGLPAVDTWYDEVGRWSGRWTDPGITVIQDRPDITGKEPDATYNEGRSGYRTSEYYNPYWTMMRKEDARAVFEKLGPLGARHPMLAILEPVTDVRMTMKKFGFAGFDDILKYPDDLLRYARIIEEDKPEVIVETGTRNGASARWFAKLGLDVITVDIDHGPLHPEAANHHRIVPVLGSSTDHDVLKRVVGLVNGRRCMMSLDSDHTKDHVAQEIAMYAPLVSPGCHLVVEDGIFRYAIPREWEVYSFGDYAKGTPLDAIEDSYLTSSSDWERDTDVEGMTSITHHVAGWWKRRA